MTEEISDRFYYTSRCLVGALFLLSAILKFISIESFESYVFSFGFFSLKLSSYLSRFLLFAEASLGILLITTIGKKWVDYLCYFMITLFSIFLFYLLYVGDDGNCHCMGETFSLTPLQSLLKNAWLLLLLLFGSKCKPFQIKRDRLIITIVLIASFVFAFIQLPVGLGQYKETKFNEQAYHKLQEEYHELKALDEEDKVVLCFFSVKCKHCKMAMRKLEVCLKKADIQPTVQWVVWGDDVGLQEFIEETRVTPQSHFYLTPIKLMPVTEYNVPLILFMQHGEVKAKMSNATFDETACVTFLNAQDAN